MRIAALLNEDTTRRRLCSAVRGFAHITWCEQCGDLIRLVRTAAALAVVCEPWDHLGRPVAATVAHLRANYLSLPILIYTECNERSARELLVLSRAGADQVIFRGIDDERRRLPSLIASAGLKRATAEALAQLDTIVSSEVRPIVTHILHSADRPVTVGVVASDLRLDRTTLGARLSAAGLPSPGVLISWSRLALAARLLEDRGRSVEQVALALGFGSGTALRNMLRRYTGLRPMELRAKGGMGHIIELLRSEATSRGFPKTVVPSSG